MLWNYQLATNLYEYECALLNVVQVEIVCDSSGSQMVFHQYGSFDADADFQEEWTDDHMFHIGEVVSRFLEK